MHQVSGFRVKIATEDWEFQQIHRLNHLAFAEEIPQHERQASGLLVDRFHDDNTYLIALRGERMVGMLAIRTQRPFSLEQKLPGFDAYLPAARALCEIRLLAIRKADRAGRVLQHLFAALWKYSREHRFDLAVISATTRQLDLYRRAGFVAFGPIVGKEGALYQPMYITREQAAPLFRRWAAKRSLARMRAPVNLLPGPTEVRRAARERMLERAVSHRSPAFTADFARTRAALCAATGAAHAEILLGSGTLANDTIAAQLSRLRAAGLILTNGEFGDRLVDHAARFSLEYDVMRWPWGKPFDVAAIEQRLSRLPAPAWVWFVHLETSTGVLNELDRLSGLCARADARLCVDAVSSFGLVPVNLRHAWFASAVSGKGLRAAVGLAIVFHSHELTVSETVPRYLDLGLGAREGGIPFTHSSALVRALGSSVAGLNWGRRYSTIAARSAWLRAQLRAHGFEIVSAEKHAAPGIITIALPPELSSATVTDDLGRVGFLLAAHSGYLRRRNWIQLSLMSQPPGWQLRALVSALHRRVTAHPACASHARGIA
jgi:aspartate aminotransferase-like enzyme